jgi:hypothetical protein
LVIAVDNVEDIGHFGSGVNRYKGKSGGVYRPVYLEITGRTRISDIYLYPSKTNEEY